MPGPGRGPAQSKASSFARFPIPSPTPAIDSRRNQPAGDHGLQNGAVPDWSRHPRRAWAARDACPAMRGDVLGCQFVPCLRSWRRRCRGVSSRVAGRYCYLPAPSELDVRVAPHPAQAFTNAPRGTRPLWQRPSRYAPGADGPFARLSSLRWSASRAYAREPHQRAFLLPTYLLVSLSRLAEVLS